MKKMMILAAALLGFWGAAQAADFGSTDGNYNWPGENSGACYELSQEQDYWSRTPNLLCVEKNAGKARLTLLLNEMGNRRLVGEFHLDLLRSSADLEENRDAFGLANPSNSVFNALEVSFNGQRVFAMDGGPYHEQGTLNIGNNRFFYRLSPLHP